ncbi:MAG TPA: flagellar basal body P-ring protein FlgI [Terriglobales bacterium]|nr:flagellar basal body P-ring protein FlgI [Terriglobales bacterium]
MKKIAGLLILMFCLPRPVFAVEEVVQKFLIRDITSVEGVRQNPILGYGMVVGLRGTGDRQQTIFSTQTLANILQRMGVQVPATTMKVNNVAAVFVTADLPPFARPGMSLDVTVSSIGDAKSLEGGLLLLTPLYGADGRIYAEAQGALTLGGYSAGGGGNSKLLNHPTVGRIPGGGLVERDTALDLRQFHTLSLLLSDPSFTTAEDVAATINKEFGKPVASDIDGRRVDLNAAAAGEPSLPALLARVENLSVQVHRRARVVVNERTGTVVMGKDVRLGAVSILHGSFSIEVTTQLTVSQPNTLGQGQTEVVPQTNVSAEEAAARKIELTEGASVEQLVNGLQKIGATARDVIAILQAIKAAGALEADLEVI